MKGRAVPSSEKRPEYPRMSISISGPRGRAARPAHKPQVLAATGKVASESYKKIRQAYRKRIPVQRGGTFYHVAQIRTAGAGPEMTYRARLVEVVR